MPVSRLMSMQEAGGRFVPDGATVCMGTALEALIPFTAGHELIRQHRRNLTLVGPISDILVDQLVAGGCVRRVQAACVGNVSAGLGHNYQRAVEHGVPHRIEVEDHSNLSIAAALQARAMGAPYIPTRSLWGTGLLDSNLTFERSARGWIDRWVYGVAHCKGFLSALGPEAREAVRVKTRRLSEPLDYGA